jgi:hypothetical protein
MAAEVTGYFLGSKRPRKLNLKKLKLIPLQWQKKFLIKNLCFLISQTDLKTKLNEVIIVMAYNFK